MSRSPLARIPADSSVEMTWKVFGGMYETLYLALLRHRCQMDGLALDDETLATQFRLHLHRGIAYLAADRNIRSLADLMRRIVP
jgi:DNA sulfur modification protein DndE